MKKRDLFRMSIGEYELTDNINNYHYTLRIGLNEDGSRFYRIKVKGTLSLESIFMVEKYEKYEDGYKYKTLSAMAGIGGIILHSDDTHSVLRELNFIPRGSFSQFIENTKIN